MKQQRRFKVLFLTSSYPRHDDDTASIFLRYLAEYLTNSGIDVHVLAPADVNSGRSTEGGVCVHRFRYFLGAWQNLAYGSGIMPNLKRCRRHWLQVPFFLLAMTVTLLRLLRVERFDVIHAHWILPQGLIGLFGSFCFRVPLVVTAHGTDAFALRSRISIHIKNLVIKGSKCWTTNTSATADAVLQGSSRHEPRIIPMGVDIARFSKGDRASLRHELPEGEFLVLFVGRLILNKGCHNLLKAISLLPSSISTRTTLWVVGDGDERLTLEERATKLEIRDRVRFFGAVNHQRLADFYAAADILVVPSLQAPSGELEGQGIVILEGFAARCCVLASRIGGISEVVTNNNTGVLVEPNDPNALAAAMESLLLDSALRRRLTDSAFAEVATRYSWERIAGEFANLYREATTPRGLNQRNNTSVQKIS